uniref:dolichol kinase n=1 Tax=Picocystis salinarum TaxID=88271 RepID=A0A7S3UB06_9CHLO
MEWTVFATATALRIAFRSSCATEEGGMDGRMDGKVTKELGRGLVQTSMGWTCRTNQRHLWCGAAWMLLSAAARVETVQVVRMAVEILLMRLGEELELVGPGEAVLFGIGTMSLLKATAKWTVTTGRLGCIPYATQLLEKVGVRLLEQPSVSFLPPEAILWHTTVVLLCGLGIFLLLGLWTSKGNQKQSHQGRSFAVFLLNCWIFTSLAWWRVVGVEEAQALVRNVVGHVMETRARILCCTVWLLQLLVLVPVTFLLAYTCGDGLEGQSKEHMVSCWRKAWHVLLMCMIVPFVANGDTLFVGLALAYVVLAFVVLNLLIVVSRGGRIVFLDIAAPFLDSRDQGNIIASHISLVASFGIPIWILNMFSFLKDDSCLMLNKTRLPHLKLFSHSGMITVGVGDTLAAFVGCFVGKTHLFHKKKTLEGSLAAVVGMAVYAIVLNRLTDILDSASAFCAAICVAVVELVSIERDNTILPVVFMACYWLFHAIMQAVI